MQVEEIVKKIEQGFNEIFDLTEEIENKNKSKNIYEQIIKLMKIAYIKGLIDSEKNLI